ncbi:MAG: hypothetical protein QM645_11435 [Asticcacaulis sp.]
MTRTQLIDLWISGFFSALTVAVGRMGYALFVLAPDPPTDPEELKHWQRRRRWLAISEISALPAFATIGVMTMIYLDLPTVSVALISMALGGLGFGFLLNGLKYLADIRLKKLGGEQS